MDQLRRHNQGAAPGEGALSGAAPGGAATVRILATTRGLDAARLVAGEDLVLAVEEADGVELPAGVLAQDHLGLEARARADGTAVVLAARWRAALAEALTVDGVCLPWLWEWALLEEVVAPTVRDALSLHAALAALRPKEITLALAPADDGLRPLVAAVAASLGIRVRDGAAPASPAEPPKAARPVGLARRARRVPVRAVRLLGLPSALRRDATLVIAYWPLVPLVDRMLGPGGRRPALFATSPPSGPLRALRMAARGGWVGLPGPRIRRRAATLAAAALEQPPPGPALDAGGVELGPMIHERILALGRRRAAGDLALAAVVRSAVRRGRPGRVVGTYDVMPHARMVLAAARNAGVPTLLVAHGACLIPQVVSDVELSDEVALWSEAIAPPIADRDRPIHVVGYPLAHPEAPTRAWEAGGRAPRIVVIAQEWHPSTAVIDARAIMVHYRAALEAIERRVPGATVLLRPHPAHDLAPTRRAAAAHPALDVRVDVSPDILALLGGCDLCIGAASTASLQAALTGTPLVLLNLLGTELPWPLGGATSVPVARSQHELAGWLDRWQSGEVLPGADDLRRGLGADGGDAVGRLLEVVDGLDARRAGGTAWALSGGGPARRPHARGSTAS